MQPVPDGRQKFWIKVFWVPFLIINFVLEQKEGREDYPTMHVTEGLAFPRTNKDTFFSWLSKTEASSSFLHSQVQNFWNTNKIGMSF